MSTILSSYQKWHAEVEANNAARAARAAREAQSTESDESAQTTQPAQRAFSFSLDLGYLPFPRQKMFHESGAKYRLFGGAAGPGKSKALLMETILKANENPGSNTLLLRRTFPELEQSLLLYFRREVPRELYRNFNESKHVVTWLNGSTTRFGYCQNENDVYQYQGAEFLFIGIDELTLFTLRQWQFLTSRNRCPIANTKPGMAAATNPGNIGHAWVKSLWIDRKPAPGMDNPDAYDPGDYDFVPARVGDNPIYANDENYLKTLRALPTHLRRAFLDGDWEVFAGQYFDNFDYARHVVRAESLAWQSWWPRWISVDWGFEHPAAVYWHAAVPGRISAVGAQHAVPGNDAWRDAGRGPGSTVGSAHVECGGSPPLFSAEACLGDRNAGSASWQAGTADSGAKAPHSTYGGNDRVADNRAQDSASRASNAACVVSYREYVTHRTSPRDLAREIIGRSVQSDASSVGAQSANISGRMPGNDAWRDLGHHPGSTVGSAHVECGGSPPLFSAEARLGNPNASSTSRQAGTADSGAKAPHSTYGGNDFGADNRGQGNAAPEKIDAIYLSPDAFARRTDEASIAEQMGDVFAAAGLPRPTPADDDRIGGWMLMYQMLSTADRGDSSLGDQDHAWLITDNCAELIRTLPSLVRDPARVEDIEKMDGDDSADAARYGLKSRYAMLRGGPDGWRSRMPLVDRIAAHEYSVDPTVRAMQVRKFSIEESRGRAKPVKFLRRHRW